MLLARITEAVSVSFIDSKFPTASPREVLNFELH